MPPDAERLLAVLFDSEALNQERDNAATDLEEFDLPEVEAKLIAIASDPATPPVVAEAAAGTLGVWWRGRGGVNRAAMKRMPEPVRKEIQAFLDLPQHAVEPAAASRRKAPAFLRWFGLGVYVALLTVLPSAFRG